MTILFWPKCKSTESFCYFEDPVNVTTLLLWPGFYGPGQWWWHLWGSTVISVFNNNNIRQMTNEKKK